MTIVPAGCQERLLIWGSSRESVYGATFRLCSSRRDYLSSKEGYISTQTESKAWFEKFCLTILVLAFANVIQITQSSFGAQGLAL